MLFLKGVVILAGALGCLFLAFRHLETKALFFPTRALPADPLNVNIYFENVAFKTADRQELHGWYIPVEGAWATVLFCHGNAGNIGHRIDKLVFLRRLGLSVFMFDYRGYGKSQGKPSEKGFYKDVTAAYDFLLERGIPTEQIIGYGESLGGAVIMDLATRRPLRALILDSTFTSIEDMATIHYPFIPHKILAYHFDSKNKIASISVPKLIIHSENDEIVPFSLGQKLFEAAASPKDFLKISGDHNEGFFESEELVRKKIIDFFAPLAAS